MVGVKIRRMENREKYGEKWHFLLFVSREKTRETENRKKNNPYKPTFFYPPNLGGKWGEKCRMI